MKREKKIYEIALALTCSLAATLKAQNLYVVNEQYGTIGEYGLDGSTVNASLISGLDDPTAIAISGNDLFVANQGNGTIGEYTTSGAMVNASLISGLYNPDGIAVSGNDLFVSYYPNSYTPFGNVGEYTTSGATVNAVLVPSVAGLCGVATSDSDLFVAISDGIGQYTTSGAVENFDLISGVSWPRITISGNNIFVANNSDNATFNATIAEYGLDGSTVNASLITFGYYYDPTGIAASGNDLFVANGGTISEYTTSGTTVNASLITALGETGGIAISPVPEPSAVALAALGATVLWLWRRRK